ncbi:MAG: hypothetical protein ACOYNY_23695 [Caldilineaceae bacterium]
MANVLTMASVIGCNHNGKVAFKKDPTSCLTIEKARVLHIENVQQLFEPSLVKGCKTPKSQSSKPCENVVSIEQEKSSRLTVGGKPVLIDTLKGKTDGVKPVEKIDGANPEKKADDVDPTGVLAAKANQNKLTAK